MADRGVRFDLQEATAGEERPADPRIDMGAAHENMEVCGARRRIGAD